MRLNKHELAALDRHRKREEKEKKKRAAERKKRKDQRVAVPLTQLEPASRKKSRPPTARQPRQDTLPRYPSSGSNLGEDQDQRHGYPPIGYFPPSTTPRSRARSGTTSKRTPSRPPSRAPSRAPEERGGTSYDYGASSRHVSDSMAGAMPPDEPWAHDGSSSGSRTAPDPFRFQTSGPRSSVGSPASASSRRHTMAPSEAAYMGRRRAAGPVTRSRASNMDPESTSEEEDDSEDESDGSSEERQSSSDNTGNGVRTRAASRGRTPASVVEASQEPEAQPQTSKKSSKNPSPSKRKPARGGRRRK